MKRQRIKSFFSELRRRHVVQVTCVYLVAVWGLSAGAVDIFDVMGLPTLASRYFVIALFALAPVVVAVSWFFEADSTGIYRDHGPRTDAESDTPSPEREVDNGPVRLTASFRNTTLTFNDDFTVGRDDSCEFQIVDPQVSRYHARFECVDGVWCVRDLDSANGISVGEDKVRELTLGGQVALSFYPGAPAFKVSIEGDTKAATLIVGD